MTLREKLNEKPQFALVFIVIVLVIAGAIVYLNSGDIATQIAKKMYYSDDDGKICTGVRLHSRRPRSDACDIPSVRLGAGARMSARERISTIPYRVQPAAVEAVLDMTDAVGVVGAEQRAPAVLEDTAEALGRDDALEEESGEDSGHEGLQNLEEPDVCRLYKLYGECGKFVNLADWFEAFKQTVQHDETAKAGRQDTASANQNEDNVDVNGGDEPATPSKRRSPSKRTVQLADADDYDPDLLDTPSRKRSRFAEPLQAEDQGDDGPASEMDLQCRFALALNQLARMGMIRGTKRRNEHITKVLWDLVPETF